MDNVNQSGKPSGKPSSVRSSNAAINGEYYYVMDCK